MAKRYVLFAALLVASVSGFAQGDIVVIKGIVDTTMPAKDWREELRDCARNATCAGLMNSMVPGSSLVAAELPHRSKGEEHYASFYLPSGYEYCGSEISFKSIVPKSNGKRPVFSARAVSRGVDLYYTTPKLRQRSWVDAAVAVYGVRSDLAASKRRSGDCKAPGDRIILECGEGHQDCDGPYRDR